MWNYILVSEIDREEFQIGLSGDTLADLNMGPLADIIGIWKMWARKEMLTLHSIT